MRAFISLNLLCDESISKVLADLNSIGVKTVNSNQLHITLRFLGDIDKKHVDNISKAVEATADEFHRFDMKINKVGTFPRKDGSGIVWIGSDDQTVIDISKKLDELLYSNGIDRENKPFKNHVTIARPKHDIKDINEYLNSREYHFKEQSINSMFLMSSVLTPAGPIYTIEKEYPLISDNL
ncbi:RNA 2',3'-cyclic phosphodiesterase [Candidatus Methanomassiliicoccus intestinalis]|uniref:RNA 2',3'-cyclic phosphodiesterase n=1 Tax=Candidatus Methanomassiliicoccus intestinalis TaxID=1406512 RepID=UPI0037DC6FF0